MVLFGTLNGLKISVTVGQFINGVRPVTFNGKTHIMTRPQYVAFASRLGLK
jgi:hypothetical protein